jgi:hypothetical protein
MFYSCYSRYRLYDVLHCRRWKAMKRNKYWSFMYTVPCVSMRMNCTVFWLLLSIDHCLYPMNYIIIYVSLVFASYFSQEWQGFNSTLIYNMVPPTFIDLYWKTTQLVDFIIVRLLLRFLGNAIVVWSRLPRWMREYHPRWAYRALKLQNVSISWPAFKQDWIHANIFNKGFDKYSL